MPHSKRPPERFWSVAIALAVTTGSRCGAEEHAGPDVDRRGQRCSGGERDERIDRAQVLLRQLGISGRGWRAPTRRDVGVFRDPHRIEAPLLGRDGQLGDRDRLVGGEHRHAETHRAPCRCVPAGAALGTVSASAQCRTQSGRGPGAVADRIPAGWRATTALMSSSVRSRCVAPARQVRWSSLPAVLAVAAAGHRLLEQVDPVLPMVQLRRTPTVALPDAEADHDADEAAHDRAQYEGRERQQHDPVDRQCLERRSVPEHQHDHSLDTDAESSSGRRSTLPHRRVAVDAVVGVVPAGVVGGVERWRSSVASPWASMAVRSWELVRFARDLTGCQILGHGHL